MPSFCNQGVEIAYADEGDGEPILLIHGFASNHNVNWRYPGWISELTKAGKRVISFDNRGHGESSKLYDPSFYSVEAMAGDAQALMDHLGIERADVMGYSLGARITAHLALGAPHRVACAVLGGLGIGLVKGGGPDESVAKALETPDLAAITQPMAKMFRTFADQTRSDRLALAACLRGTRSLMTVHQAGSISRPVLIAVGTEDKIAGSAAELQTLIPGSEVLDIPGRDHMKAVGDRVFKAGVLAYLAQRTA